MADIDSKLPVQDSADGTDGASAPVIVQQVGGIDGSGNLQSISVDTSGHPNVNVLGTVPVSGTFFQATQPVSAAALPLPSGASTSALQTTGNTSLSSIDTKTPALGQALAAASTPVVLTAAQISTLTPLSSVTVTQATGTNLHTVVDKVALTGSSPATVTIAATSTSAVASNGSRKGLILTNTTSLSTISLNVAGGSAVLNSGITLYPHDSWVMDEYSFTTAAINAIASVGSSTLSIQEFT